MHRTTSVRRGNRGGMRLIVEGLSVERGGDAILTDIGFSLGDGEALLVTGPNGAGKTTLMRAIAGLLPVTSGTIRVEDADGTADISSTAHFLGPINAMKTALSVSDNLRFWQDFAGDADRTVAAALEAVGLPGIGHLPFGVLSTGQKRRVAIARLLLSRRPLWLVDEPTAGLDRRAEQAFSALLKAHLAGGGLLVASTHLPLGLDGARELVLGGRQ